MPKRRAIKPLPPAAPPAARIDALILMMVDEQGELTHLVKVERELADELGLADDWALLANGLYDSIPYAAGSERRAAASRLSCATHQAANGRIALDAVHKDHAELMQIANLDIWNPQPSSLLPSRMHAPFERGALPGAMIRVWLQ